MRTLVTGAAGYIGLHLVRELVAHGHQVTALVRSRDKLGPYARDARVAVVEADLRGGRSVAAAVSGHHVCVHAALIWGDPGTETRDTSAAERLFDAAGRAGVARCLYFSSAAVFRPFKGEMSEDDALRPEDVYGATKLAGEEALRAACARHGMVGVVLRPGPVVGPPAFAGGSFRTPAPIEELVRAAETGREITVVQGEGRQLSDVAMVARAVRLLTRTPNPEATYLSVDRDVMTSEQAARTVVEVLGSSSRVRVVPREDVEPIPRFSAARVERLLGEPASAVGAFREHLRCLVGR